MIEVRCRIPVRLIQFVPLIGVGLRHLVVVGGLDDRADKEPVKQVRIKYTLEDQVIIDQLTTEFEARPSRVILEALECASRCRLNPISGNIVETDQEPRP